MHLDRSMCLPMSNFVFQWINCTLTLTLASGKNNIVPKVLLLVDMGRMARAMARNEMVRGQISG
jgi:hypothetical protein